MTNQTDNPMNAATELIIERQQYENWLTMLEAKRAVTPPHVFDRVHGDYKRRLDEVTDKLKGRTSEIKETIAALAARVKEAHAKERELTDERFEAELRATVGEFSSERWDDLSRRTDAEINRLAADRKVAAAEIDRLNQILAMATNPEVAAKGAPAAGSSKVGGSASALAPVPKSPSGDVAPAESAPPPRQSFDELAFLQSVTGQKEEAAATRRSDPAAAPTPPPAPAPPAPEPLPVRRAPSGNSAAIPPRAHDEATESPTAAPLGPGADEPPQRGGDPAPYSRDTGPMSSILRDVPQEHVKTLKCAECKAMNYPTEWYCERCGAELAAM